MKKNIRVAYAKSVHGKKEIDAVLKVLNSSTQMGRNTVKLEKKISKLFNKDFGLMTNSGSSALYILMDILNLDPGSEIITPALTFSTTIAPIVKSGLIPSFVDVDSKTFCIDENLIEEKINGKTKAILAPDLLGNICNWPKIREIADKNDLFVLQDSADTLGAKIKGISTGKYSDFSITSFYGSHIINGAGNGGMLCLNDEELFKKAKLLRSWGRSSSLFDNSESIKNRFNVTLDGITYDSKFIFEEMGYQLEPSEISSAFALTQLQSLAKGIKKRRQIFNQHQNFFSKYEEFLDLPNEKDDVYSGWLAYPLIVKEFSPFTRTDLQIYLEKRNIQTRVIFTGNILRQPGFKNINCIGKADDFINADKVMRGGILIACHNGLTQEMIDHVHNSFDNFINKKSQINSKKLHQIKACEVCGSKKLSPVLDLGNHPMCDDLIPTSEDSICEEYPIKIAYCKNCFTAHQIYQVPKKKLFPSDYHYRSRFTADVLKGMSDLVNSCEEFCGTLKDKTVLDIGCNDGSLLDFFSQKGCKTIGIEPTDAYKDCQDKGHKSYGNYLSPATAKKVLKENGVPDIITFTNVFAHIENLPEVLDSLEILSNKDTVLVIENHYLGAVLEKYQFDTFYHEHPRTYSFNSFIHIAKSLKAKIKSVEFPSRYGGNIRVFISKKKTKDNLDINDILIREKNFYDDLVSMNDQINSWKLRTRKHILSLYEKYGSLSCKAFPGRAAILIKLLELNENVISCVYEKPGSLKIGHFVPGTRIPILSDKALFCKKNQPPIIINLAWHIKKEIKNYLKDKYQGEIFNILELKDFK